MSPLLPRPQASVRAVPRPCLGAGRARGRLLHLLPGHGGRGREDRVQALLPHSLPQEVAGGAGAPRPCDKDLVLALPRYYPNLQFCF